MEELAAREFGGRITGVIGGELAGPSYPLTIDRDKAK